MIYEPFIGSTFTAGIYYTVVKFIVGTTLLHVKFVGPFTKRVSLVPRSSESTCGRLLPCSFFGLNSVTLIGLILVRGSCSHCLLCPTTPNSSFDTRLVLSTAGKRKMVDVESADHEQGVQSELDPLIQHVVKVPSVQEANVARAQFLSLCWSMFVMGWTNSSSGPLLPRIQVFYGVSR
jgi:hypothetical protein